MIAASERKLKELLENIGHLSKKEGLNVNCKKKINGCPKHKNKKVWAMHYGNRNQGNSGK